MYASVAKFRFTRPVETGDFEVNERVLVPLLKRQPGYQGYFEVLAGETFGFLGPNGAGKTTTINMLCTLTRPTAGHGIVGCYR